MECKGKVTNHHIIYFTIGIYPEWNVKTISTPKNTVSEFIGIYPEWNVKSGILLS